MGYNLTRHAVARNKPQLDQLVGATESLRFATPNPTNLAHKLREAIKAAGKFQDLKHYAKLGITFQFKVERDAVLAEYMAGPVGTPVGENDLPTGGNDKKVQKGTIESSTSLMDVLAGALEGEKQGYIELFFPNVILRPEDRIKLFDWTMISNGWGFMDHEDKGITLTKQEEHQELLWEPEDA